jgi:flagellar biosynthesis/type III secretory pathway M-ring protein FliF/YscJ
MRDSRNYPDEGLFRKIGMLVLLLAIMSIIFCCLLGNFQNTLAEEGDSEERQITGDKGSSSESTFDKFQIVLILVIIIIILLILIIILQFLGDESSEDEGESYDEEEPIKEENEEDELEEEEEEPFEEDEDLNEDEKESEEDNEPEDKVDE